MMEPLLEVRGLKKYFQIATGALNRTKQFVRSVDGIDLTVYAGETLGIVGESGCGKSTTGRAILRLQEPTAGEVIFAGKDLAKLKKEEMRQTRREIQMVFQDPFASLNPRKTIKQILMEPLRVHNIGTKAERVRAVEKMIEIVGLQKEHLHRHPHHFSGGQRQRIGIARALILNPKLIIADEPVSALDVSIQSQILNLIKDLKREYNLTLLFISHDLSVVKHICDRIAVMYLGKIVEIGTKQEIFTEPKHPYTQALLSAIPQHDREKRRERILLKGDLPSPANPPSGCAFHTRCIYAFDTCKMVTPPLQNIGGNQQVACHLMQKEDR